MQIDEGIDILSPTIRNVNGSFYRVLHQPLTTIQTGRKAGKGPRDTLDLYEDEPNTCVAPTGNRRGGEWIGEADRRGGEWIGEAETEWKTAEIPTPCYFHKYIVGKGGVVKKRLEGETNTRIEVPKPHEKKDLIKVQYKSEDSFSSLEFRIENIVEKARKRERPSHFLSIPVKSEAISKNLAKFQEICEDKIHPHKIQYPNKLHLTLGVLKLFSKNEVEKATQVLKEFAPKIPYILCGRPLRGTLKNLEIMNDEPQSVSVLYSELILRDESDRLQHLADQCFELFVEKDLMDYEGNRNSSSVKLHCTLINTRWNSEGPRTIDASEILSEEFELQTFGDCVLETLDLNEMVTDRNKNYVNVSSVKLVN